MHCFCSTGSVMKQHYSSCCLSKQLFFFFFFLSKALLGILQESPEKNVFDFVALPFYYLYFFFRNCGRLFATVVLCGNWKCTVEISNRKEKFEIGLAKSICADES